MNQGETDKVLADEMSQEVSSRDGAYRNKRSVIFKELVGGQATIIDEERVLQNGWRESRQWRI